MMGINTKVKIEGDNFVQQYILQRGLNEYKERGYIEAAKDLYQLHRFTWFSPIYISKLTP